MPYECPICKLVPGSHSLTKISEKNGVEYYYTCPSQATLYYDVKGILNHCDGVLGEIPEDKEWVWIFDCFEFGVTRALKTDVAIQLVNLILNKFSKNLKKIIVINPTFYTSITHTLIRPFLNNKVRNIIEINYESTSAEEVFS